MRYNPYPIKHDDGTVDERYQVTLEYTGHKEPQYVARFCDDWIDCREYYTQACMLCVFHSDDKRLGLNILA